MHNATTAALYADVDYSSLSWIEQQWMAWYLYIGNPILATGLMSFLMHEVRRNSDQQPRIISSLLDCLLWP
jgi:methylsterol monooxygenase